MAHLQNEEYTRNTVNEKSGHEDTTGTMIYADLVSSAARAASSAALRARILSREFVKNVVHSVTMMT